MKGPLPALIAKLTSHLFNEGLLKQGSYHVRGGRAPDGHIYGEIITIWRLWFACRRESGHIGVCKLDRY